MFKKKFAPQHINADENDFAGNNGIGRYVFLPGSDERAKIIATCFENLTIKTHPRGHHLYLGTIPINEKEKVAVACISTGMGCPSTEIILHELFILGAKRFLRIGTSGSLQPWINISDIVNVHAAVRDESTSTHYAPIEIPAVASLEFVTAVLIAAERLKLSNVYTGTVHCKSALYAREYGEGPRHTENVAYLELLAAAGVIASEMETATLFIQTLLYNHHLRKKGSGPQNRVLAGAILSVVATPGQWEALPEVSAAIREEIQLALEAVRTLAIQELAG